MRDRSGRVTHIFPPEGSGTFDAVDVPDRVVASGHEAIAWFTFDHVNAVGGKLGGGGGLEGCVAHTTSKR